MQYRVSLLTIVVAALVLLAGCGGTQSPSGTTTSPTVSPAPPPTTVQSTPPTTVTATSSATTAPGTTATPAVPPGWAGSGLDNATRAVRAARAELNGTDYREEMVAVSPSQTGEGSVVVRATARVDHDSSRILLVERSYRVSNATGRAVLEEGAGALGDRTPDAERRNFVNATGYLFQSIEEGTLNRSEFSANQTFALFQPGPFLGGTAYRVLRASELAPDHQADGTFHYRLTGFSGSTYTDVSGEVSVTNAGVVTVVSYTARYQGKKVGLSYRLTIEDVTVSGADG